MKIESPVEISLDASLNVPLKRDVFGSNLKALLIMPTRKHYYCRLCYFLTCMFFLSSLPHLPEQLLVIALLVTSYFLAVVCFQSLPQNTLY